MKIIEKLDEDKFRFSLSKGTYTIKLFLCFVVVITFTSTFTFTFADQQTKNFNQLIPNDNPVYLKSDKNQPQFLNGSFESWTGFNAPIPPPSNVTGSSNALPINWVSYNDHGPSTANKWAIETRAAYIQDGTKSARHYATTTWVRSWLISETEILIESGKTYTITLWQRKEQMGGFVHGNSRHELRLAVKGNNGFSLAANPFIPPTINNHFTTLLYEEVAGVNITDWTQVTKKLNDLPNFNDLVGETIYVSFLFEAPAISTTANRHRWFVDNISLTVEDEPFTLTMLVPLPQVDAGVITYDFEDEYSQTSSIPVPIAASPRTGYTFVEWNQGSVTNLNHPSTGVDISSPGNQDIQATFSAIEDDLLWRQHSDAIAPAVYNFINSSTYDKSTHSAPAFRNPLIYRNLFATDDISGSSFEEISRIVFYGVTDGSWSPSHTESFVIELHTDDVVANTSNDDWDGKRVYSNSLDATVYDTGHDITDVNSDTYRVYKFEIVIDPIIDISNLSLGSNNLGWISIMLDSRTNQEFRILRAENPEPLDELPLQKNYQRRFDTFNSNFIAPLENSFNHTMLEIWGRRSFYWTGVQDNNWHNLNNWSMGVVPNSSSNLYSYVIIPDVPNNPIISNNDGSIKNLIIETGGILSISSGQSLDIKGNLIVDGTFNSAGGTLLFTGNGSQQLTATLPITLGEFEIASTSNLTVNGDITLRGNMQVNSGTFTHATGTFYFGKQTGTQTFSGILPTINLNNVTVNSAASVNLQMSDISITVNGSWIVTIGNYTFDDGTIVFNGSSAQTLKPGNNSWFNNVTLNSNLEVNDNNMVVKGELNINDQKVIFTPQNIFVQIDNGGEITFSGNGRIAGKVRHYISNAIATYNIPIGTDLFTRRVQIAYTGTPTAGYLDVQFETFENGTYGSFGSVENYYGAIADTLMDGSNIINTLSDVGVWEIGPAGTPAVSGGTYSVLFDAVGMDPSSVIVDPTKLRMVKTSSNPASWTVPGTATTVDNISGGYRLGRTGVSGYSHWALGSNYGSNPLPVELYHFNAYTNDESVIVEWTTASETNNSHFIIERAYSKGLFIPIATISGGGNSSSLLYYSHTDIPENTPGIIYYRLIQYDFDGQSETFDPVAVYFGSQSDVAVHYQLYPNPASGHINILLQSTIETDIVVELFSTTGHMVLQQRHELINGRNNPVIRVDHLPAGVYILRIVSNDVVFDPQRVVIEN